MVHTHSTRQDSRLLSLYSHDLVDVLLVTCKDIRDISGQLYGMAITETDCVCKYIHVTERLNLFQPRKASKFHAIFHILYNKLGDFKL